MSTRLTRIVVCLRISFLFDPIVCMPHVVELFIWQYLLLLVFVNYAAVKMDVHISVQGPAFNYFVYSQREEMWTPMAILELPAQK